MFKKVFLSILGLFLGLFIGYLIISYIPNFFTSSPILNPVNLIHRNTKKEVLGFLPYWLLDKAKPDYSGYITTLDYFSLTPDKDGTILKFVNPIEAEPGWYALNSGKLDVFFANAKKGNIKLSLTVFQSDQESIDRLLDNPVTHAQNLIKDVAPIMQKYGFSDLNLDIESFTDATPQSQLKFTQFVSETKKQIDKGNLGTLSIDISPGDFIKPNRLIKPSDVVDSVSKIILMAYDYHNPSSFVTGPVAPLEGAGTISEFDVKAGVEEALKVTSPDKILLGIPFYGYSWETIDDFPRAAIIPATAVIVSNQTIEEFVSKCSSCSAQLDSLAKEKFIIYKDTDTQTFHQIFYPDASSTNQKANFVNQNNLSGLAIWALGYEDQTILGPIQNFLSNR